MKTSAPADHDDLRDALRALCADFPAAYHRRHGADETYPEEFIDALTKAVEESSSSSEGDKSDSQ